MLEIFAGESGLLDVCLETFGEYPVIMLEFPEVFALMALPNQDGVHGLDKAKQRLPQKFYGSVVGDEKRFFGMCRQFPEYLDSETTGSHLEGCIARIDIGDKAQQSKVCPAGTHQALFIPPGPMRSLFTDLELALENIADYALFLGHRYSAPLCTSANLSGDPAGSITEIDRAREFGKAAGLPLLIRCREQAQSKGSYPVLSLGETHIQVEREGPGLDLIRSRFPDGIFRNKMN
jgi:hypothetical protein